LVATVGHAGGSPLKVALIYDMDACRGPTGVTRHALAQLEGLGHRPDVALSVVSGRIKEPDGLIFWDSLGDLRRRELPLSTRNMLRAWRLANAPPIDWWTGQVDWVYSPAEYYVPTRSARLAVTSHDVFQDLNFKGPRRRALLSRVFERAARVLSVSEFNTARLREAFPTETRDKLAYVPNAADDLFFDPADSAERAGVRPDLGLPAGMPFLLSVANFQPRKNLPNLVRAAGRLPEVARGELALVLIGDGDEAGTRAIREAAATIDARAVVKLPGYRQGKALRAIYAEAFALCFPSSCESFGIPAVEAMAQGLPVALADSTALPEIGGEAGWYFPPDSVEAIAGTLRDLLDRGIERSRKAEAGRTIASRYRWSAATDRLVAALRG
jgi:glycosyltransferase involved in cell wall biosynthesis